MANSDLAARLQQEIITSMKAKQKERLGVLRMMQAAVKQKEVDERIELDDAAVTTILTAYAKKVKDQINSFRDGGREELLARAEAELAIVAEFLPAEMGDAELEQLVRTAVEESGASGPRDMGKVMKVLMPRTAGKADGSRVSGMVKRILAGG